MEQPSNASTIRCIVVTPEETVLDEQARFVAAPLYDGEIGISPLHAPMLGRLGYGELRIETGGGQRRYYVDGGFVEVAENVVSVLTNRAVPAEQLDAEVVEEQLESARARKANSQELLEIRDRLQLQARAQLRIARHTQS